MLEISLNSTSDDFEPFDLFMHFIVNNNNLTLARTLKSGNLMAYHITAKLDCGEWHHFDIRDIWEELSVKEPDDYWIDLMFEALNDKETFGLHYLCTHLESLTEALPLIEKSLTH